MLSTTEGHLDSSSFLGLNLATNALPMETHHASKTEGLKRAINQHLASLCLTVETNADILKNV